MPCARASARQQGPHGTHTAHRGAATFIDADEWAGHINGDRLQPPALRQRLSAYRYEYLVSRYGEGHPLLGPHPRLGRALPALNHLDSSAQMESNACTLEPAPYRIRQRFVPVWQDPLKFFDDRDL